MEIGSNLKTSCSKTKIDQNNMKLPSSQLTFTCLNSTIEILEKGVKYV